MMTKEMLLLLSQNIESKKENTDKLFEIKLEELREYQKETQTRVEKIKKEYFPEEIYKMFTKIILNSFGKYDYGWYSFNIKNEKISLFYSGDSRKLFSSLCYDGKTFPKGELYQIIPSLWSKEIYRDSNMNEYKLQLDLLNKFLNLLENNIEEVYIHIANEIKIVEEKKAKTNNKVLESFSSLEKKEESKATKKVKIIIEIEE